MYKILLVEDDPTITEVLERQLAKWGYEASHVTDFQHVLETFVQQAPHLVLLDISLPFYDGYHWCGEIRKISKTPVLFISSASDNMNLVMALNMGGDDFLAKPFDLNVAIAKIEALLRRTYDFGAGVNALACRGAVLDLKDASLHYNSQKLELTKNEFRILQLLFERRGRTVPREDIMQALWESDSFIDDNTLTVNVARLRAHLAEIGLEGLIRTQKGRVTWWMRHDGRTGASACIFQLLPPYAPGVPAGGAGRRHAVRGDHSVPRAAGAAHIHMLPCRRCGSRVLFFRLCPVLPPACRAAHAACPVRH